MDVFSLNNCKVVLKISQRNVVGNKQVSNHMHCMSHHLGMSAILHTHMHAQMNTCVHS